MKYILILLLLIGCKNEPQVLKEVIFDVGFQSSGRYSGTFFDIKLNKQVVMFGDASTSQKLKFFNTDGSFIKEVDLSFQAKQLPEITYIWLSSMDSISLLSQDIQKIVSINSFGEKLDEINLQSIIFKSGDVYTYTAGFNPSMPMVWNGHTFIRCNWKESLNKIELVHSVKNFYINAFEAIKILSIAKTKDSNLISKAVVSQFYRNLSTTPKAYPEGVRYSILNDKLFITSSFSKKIFIYNPENGTLFKTVTINSKYGKFTATGVPLDPESILNLNKLATTQIKSASLGNVFYEEIEKKYIVIVQHQVPTIKEIRNRTFSIITLDENFQQKSEAYFNAKKFYFYSSMMIDGKIWLEYKDQEPNKKKYAILDL